MKLINFDWQYICICCARFRILAESKSAGRFRLKPSRPPDLEWRPSIQIGRPIKIEIISAADFIRIKSKSAAHLEWINFEFTDVENESTRDDKQFLSVKNQVQNVENKFQLKQISNAKNEVPNLKNQPLSSASALPKLFDFN